MQNQSEVVRNDIQVLSSEEFIRESFQKLNSIKIGDLQLNVADLQNGPFKQEQRECKDLFCFFFYWINTVAMIVLSTWAYFAGQPKNIFRATDSVGNICGQQKTGLQLYRYSYFYNPTNFHLSNRVCVTQCPKFVSGTLSNITCYPFGPSCSVNVTISASGVPNQTIQNYGKYFIAYQSKQRIDRICLPVKYVQSGPFGQYSNSMANDLIQSKMLDFISDVQNNYQWLFIMGSVAIVTSIIFWFGFKCFPSKIIWVSIFLCIALFIAIGVVFLYNGGSLTVVNEKGRLGIPNYKDRNFYVFYGGFALCFSIVVFIVSFCCCYQMYPLIQLLRIATNFLSKMPWPMVIVIQMTIMMTFFWITSVSSMIYALSASSYNAEGLVFSTVTEKSDRGIIMFIYFLINSFWTHEVFITTMTFGVAMIFSMWYFKNPQQQLNKPVLRTLNMIMRYHFGSLVYGSLVLLFVQILQFFNQMFFFIHQWKYRKSNSCFVCIDMVTHQIYKFFSKITSRFNRFAYIQIALRGKNFVEASKDGYMLIQYHRRSYGILYGLNSILSFIFKVCIALVPTIIFYCVSTFSESTETNMMEPIYYVLIIFYYSLGIASVIIGSYTAIIDTLISCYVIDQINQKKKKLKPKFADQDLKMLFELIS